MRLRVGAWAALLVACWEPSTAIAPTTRAGGTAWSWARAYGQYGDADGQAVGVAHSDRSGRSIVYPGPRLTRMRKLWLLSRLLLSICSPPLTLFDFLALISREPASCPARPCANPKRLPPSPRPTSRTSSRCHSLPLRLSDQSTSPFALFFVPCCCRLCTRGRQFRNTSLTVLESPQVLIFRVRCRTFATGQFTGTLVFDQGVSVTSRGGHDAVVTPSEHPQTHLLTSMQTQVLSTRGATGDLEWATHFGGSQLICTVLTSSFLSPSLSLSPCE